MGHCFIVVVGWKGKKNKKKSFFFSFLYLGKWYWEKRWLFSIGNGAEIRPLEMGRKSPETFSIGNGAEIRPLEMGRKSPETLWKIDFLKDELCLFFGLRFYIPVNSYDHVETVSSPNHTFYLDKLDKVVLNQYFLHILLLVTDNNPSCQWKEENDSRNYFTINLHESMGPGQDWTRDP